MHVPRSLDQAVRILIHLASKAPKSHATLDEMIEAHSIARNSLLRILMLLKKAGLVLSRNSKGEDGEEYVLAFPAEEINLQMIVDAVDSRSRWRMALSQKPLEKTTERKGKALPAWREVEKAILKSLTDTLEGYTLDVMALDAQYYL